MVTPLTTGRLPVIGLMGLLMSIEVLAADAMGRECQCRDPDGQRRDIGTVQCVDINGSAWIMRCEMSTNTPYWKQLDSVDGCHLA